MQRTLGIDLGTTNSVMAYLSRGEPKILLNRQNRDSTPSAVALGKRGDLLVGAPARGRGAEAIVSVKRFMGRRFDDAEVQAALDRVAYDLGRSPDGDVQVRLGGRDYSPIEVSALILRRLKLDAELRTHEEFNRAVITVPAYFGERQVAATREAGRLAGFQVLKIINEPTAAAIAFGLTADAGDEPRTILVYDLGGGTFDISILLLVQGMIDVIGIRGDNLLGGDDFDDLLRRRLSEAAAAEHGVDLADDVSAQVRLRSAAEEAKVALSDQLATDIVLPALGREAISLDTEVSREEFEALVGPAIDRTVDLVRQALADAHLDVASVDQVLLVGGSTAIPMVEQRLTAVFGAGRIRKDVNPMQCVAVGAAIQTALLAHIECPSCGLSNALQDEACACGASLVGSRKVDCATCFLPVDATAAACGKCGTAVADSPAAPTASAGPSGVEPTAELWACDRCGKANAPEAKACSVCGATAADAGLRCPACARVNPTGVDDCVGCGAAMPISNPQDITPKDLGVELDDGRMSVVIPKGTTYPTSSPVSRDFRTAGGGSTRLEVSVYEGTHDIAELNELCGHVNVQLPPDLPNGTPLTVSFGLSGDRTITVSVHVKAPGMQPHTVQLQRFGRLDPAKRSEISEVREGVVGFLDAWDREMTERERSQLLASVQQLEGILLEGPGSEPVDREIRRTREQLAAVREIRGVSAQLSVTLALAGKFLTAEQNVSLASYREQLKATRERGDWIAGLATAEQARSALAALPQVISMIVDCRAFAGQGDLSPGLTMRVNQLMSRLDDAVEADDTMALDAALKELPERWSEVMTELAEDRRGPAGPVKPTDRGN
ncbi:Hsp70 family protein [Uniformispora flossi]|uniref:Hsp70 family protein n=1 Tax=Uniformispora flossi TaxID=3390723 RepID=UPI003C2BCC6E